MELSTIARGAISAALRTRMNAGLCLDGAICVFDLAQQLGIEVRFIDIPTFEGMYCHAAQPTIILSSLRPPGRRVFTCGHEIGHHSKKDGSCVDEFKLNRQPREFDVKEFAADCFAGALLMPKMAVVKAFKCREWEISDCTPAQIFTLANYFGVGYSTLVHHLCNSLTLLSHSHAHKLLKVKRRKAQAQALGWEMNETVWLVDKHWTERPIDVEVGDHIFVRGQSLPEGDCIEPWESTREGRIIRAQRPGIGRIEFDSAGAAFVRVSRQGYVGRNCYRHLKDSDC